MKAKKVTFYGLLVAVALILSYVESFVPFFFAVPGIKMGLPNIAIVFILYKMGTKEAATVSLIRVFIVSLLFGNVISFVFSISGACVSICVMALLRKSGKFSSTAVSVAGAVAHNVVQIAVATVVINSGVIAFWLPALCVSAVVTGLCIGLVSSLLVKRVKIDLD